MSCSNAGYESMVARARQTAESMATAIANKPTHVEVKTDSATFGAIARMLVELSNHLSGCGGDECMGQSIDGLRLWVTQDRLTMEQARVAFLTEENQRLHGALRVIADGNLESMRMAQVLGETSSVVTELQAYAGTVLRN